MHRWTKALQKLDEHETFFFCGKGGFLFFYFHGPAARRKLSWLIVFHCSFTNNLNFQFLLRSYGLKIKKNPLEKN